MAIRSFLTTMMLMAALCGCAELRAERPLFAPADQTGRAPLTEGIWIAVSDECPERYARSRGRFPADCTPFELRRAESGAWRVALRADLAYGLSREDRSEAEQSSGPFLLIVAPAAERTLQEDEFASVYLAEMRREDGADEGVGYLVIAPVGTLPASDVRVASIGCHDILRDGPIDGVTPEYRDRQVEGGAIEQDISGCVATTQAAVREAARRTMIEDFETLIGTRYVHARP
jgi:hypothetical protein